MNYSVSLDSEQKSTLLSALPNLPEGWVYETFRDCCLKFIDYRGKSPPESTHGVRLLTAKDIKNCRISFSSSRFISEDTYSKWMTRGIPQPGDIVLTTEAPLGEVAMLKEGMRFAFAQRILTIRPDPRRVDSRYLFYATQHRTVRDQLFSKVRGTTVEGIRNKDVQDCFVPLPPISEQRRIGEILGALDEKVELNHRTNETLEAIVHAIFKSWFIDFEPFQKGELVESQLGPIPKGWHVGSLGDVARNLRRPADPNNVNPDMPYIGLEHMPRGSVSLYEWGFARDVTSNKFEFRKGEILFGKLRPYFKKVGFAIVDGVCSSDILVIAPESKEWFGFLISHLTRDEFIQYTDSVSTGTKMPRVSWDDVARYRIAIPPDSVVSKFQALLSAMFEKIEANIIQSRILGELRDTILPKLLSGEIRVDAR